MSIITVCGIDPSAVHVGIAVVTFDTETKAIECLNATSINDTDGIHNKKYAYPALLWQYDRIAQGVKAYIQQYQPMLCGIELPVFKGKAAYNGGFCLQAVGIIRLVVYKLGLIEHGFSPRELKLLFTGKGTADKKEIIDKLNIMFPLQKYRTTDDHRADATMIALGVLYKEYGVRYV